MTEEQITQMAATGGPLLLALGMLLAFLWPVRKPFIEWLKSKSGAMLLALGFMALMVSGCGSFSQQRYDDTYLMKQNTFRTAKRAKEGKLTAVELRSSLETTDKALLAELALKSGADLEAERKKLLNESDSIVAELFDGDNGRE